MLSNCQAHWVVLLYNIRVGDMVRNWRTKSEKREYEKWREKNAEHTIVFMYLILTQGHG